MAAGFSVAFLGFLFVTTLALDTSILPEQCTPSLNLGGLVFSDYTRRPVEHALHWSKAQSGCSVSANHQ